MNVARTRRMAPVPRADVVGARLGRALLLLVSLGWAVPVLGAEEKPEPTPPSSEPMSAPSQPAPPPSDAATSASDSTTPPAELSPRRDVPNYRQLDSEATTAGDVLIWVPRVILLPAYLVTEYALRAPVGGISTVAEKNNWAGSLYDFFAFGPNHRGGILPTFSFNTGFRPTIGAHFFWDDTFVARNTFTADAAWGGSDWVRVAVGDRYTFSGGDWIALQAQWQRRPDYVYFGIGPDTSDDFRSRYGTDQIEGRLTYMHRMGPLRLESHGRVYRTVFRDYNCCGDPTVAERVERGELAPPPGYGQNTTAAEVGLRAVLDTRPAGYTNRSGVRIGVEVAPAVDATQGFDRSWIHYGAHVEGSWDVTGKGRVLSLGVFTAFSDPMGDQPVPFNELVVVGGTEPFAGFMAGRLRDRSAAAAQLSWRWPVFDYLDGVVAVGFGNVFDKHLSNFRWDSLRGSFEVGLRTQPSFGRSSFQMVFGMGSEPFSKGFSINSFRFALGVTYGV